MKAKINNIEFEGTPEEFAEFLMATNASASDVVKAKSEPTVKGKRGRKGIALIVKCPDGETKRYESITMFCHETGVWKTSVLRNMSDKLASFELNGYTVIPEYRDDLNIPKFGGKRIKVVDSKGDSRIYQSIIEFCEHAKITRETFNAFRKKRGEPFQIKGYTAIVID